MTTQLAMKAELRTKTGKGAAHSLRRIDRIPAVIYGKGEKEILVSLPKKEMHLLQGTFNALTTVVELEVQDKKYRVLPKQIALDPVTDHVEHVDFIMLGKEDKITIKVPVLIVGMEKSPAFKRNGTINISNRLISCIVNIHNIPENIKIDVSSMNIGDAVHFGDLQLPEDVIVKERSKDKVLLKIVGKKAIKEEEAKTLTAQTEATAEGGEKEGDKAAPGKEAGKDAKAAGGKDKDAKAAGGKEGSK